MQVIAATYKNGVFTPDERPDLLESARVKLVVEPLEKEEERCRRADSWAKLEALWSESTFNSGGDYLTRDQRHERR